MIDGASLGVNGVSSAKLLLHRHLDFRKQKQVIIGAMGAKQSRDYPGYNYPYSSARPSYGAPSSDVYNSEQETRYNPHPNRYSKFGDDFTSLEQVTDELARAGLESSNLIVGVDFTKSNEWTGKNSFNHKCLHHLGDSANPYEQAISIIGKTLSKFDEDNLIPCFGFGDASTHDKEVFSFNYEENPSYGFEEALRRYRELVPHLKLAGPTSFAPIIETAIGIVDDSGGQYHVLLIIADGQVASSVDTNSGHVSPQEEATINAIVKASAYPLSIVLIGVGDGPWDMIKQFDDNIPSRTFDNFQFVNFTEIMSRDIPQSKKETEFALAALMEIPMQYTATVSFQLLGRRLGTERRVALPPPRIINNRSYAGNSTSNTNHPEHYAGFYNHPQEPPPTNYSRNDQNNCQVCFSSVKDLAFGCGHRTCYECGREMQFCPFCDSHITRKIRLY